MGAQGISSEELGHSTLLGFYKHIEEYYPGMIFMNFHWSMESVCKMNGSEI